MKTNGSAAKFSKIQEFSDLARIINSSDEPNRWKRNLIYLCIAQFFAMMGMGACVPFLPLFVVELGISNPETAHIWSGFVFAGPYVLSIIAVPFWGVLGDRYGMKIMVVRAIIGLAISVFLMGFAQNVVQLLILRIIQGAVSGFIAAAMAFISIDSPIERRGYALGLLQSAYSAGHIFGPMFGGIISDISGIRSVFFIVGALCLISGMLVIGFVVEPDNRKRPHLQNSIISNIAFVSKIPELRLLLLMIAISQGALYFTNPVFPFFLLKLNAPETYISTITGIFVGIIGVFSIIFSPFWGKRNDKMDYRKTLFWGALISGLAIIAHTLVSHYLMLIPMRIIIGIFYAAILPTIFSAISKLAPKENSGGVMGLASSATIIGSLISYMLCGVTAANLGMLWCFVISGIFLIIVALLVRGLKIGK